MSCYSFIHPRNYHPNLDEPRKFSHALFRSSPSPSPKAITSWFLSPYFSYAWPSYKKNHTVCIPLGLTSLTQYNYFYCGKKHITWDLSQQIFNCTIVFLTIWTLLYNRSPELFSSCRNEALYSLNSNSLSSPPFSPWQPTLFCIYKFDYIKYLIWWNHAVLVLVWLAYFT